MTASSQRVSRPVQMVAVALLVLGFAISAYLTHLHIEVHGPGADSVQSFCQMSKQVDCVTVAKSEYSSFLGIPIAVYGLEYFALGLLLVLLAQVSNTFERWDSVLFDLSAMSVPFFVVLGWISTTKIHSICILCFAVYGINIVMALLLGVLGRKNLREMVTEGPRQLVALGRTGQPAGPRIALIITFLFLITQLTWMPRVFAYGPGDDERDGSSVQTAGPSKSGTYLGLPARGVELGPDDAPIKISEYTDFQCPFCSRAHHVMLLVMQRHPGKIQLIHHDYPLNSSCNRALKRPFHIHACEAAVHARCAAVQGQYWPYEGVLFSKQRQLGKSLYRSIAKQLGLDMAKFDACVASEEPMRAIRADVDNGIAAGLKGTPTFFINGKERVVGVRPLSFWDSKIRSLLESHERK